MLDLSYEPKSKFEEFALNNLAEMIPKNFVEDYSKTQILSLCKLIAYLSSTYKINYKNILGHSDIAPFRKIDPGRKFPWSELAKKGLSYLPKINQNFSSKIYEDETCLVAGTS